MTTIRTAAGALTLLALTACSQPADHASTTAKPAVALGAPACLAPEVSLRPITTSVHAGTPTQVAGDLDITPGSNADISVQVVILPVGTRPDLAQLRTGSNQLATTTAVTPAATKATTATAAFTPSIPAEPAGIYPLAVLVHSTPTCRGQTGGEEWGTEPLGTLPIT